MNIQETQLTNTPGDLLKLPEDLLVVIYGHLPDPRDRAHFACVCRKTAAAFERGVRGSAGLPNHRPHVVRLRRLQQQVELAQATATSNNCHSNIALAAVATSGGCLAVAACGLSAFCCASTVKVCVPINSMAIPILSYILAGSGGSAVCCLGAAGGYYCCCRERIAQERDLRTTFESLNARLNRGWSELPARLGMREEPAPTETTHLMATQQRRP